MQFFRTNIYIYSSVFPDQLHKVVLGTGMGMVPSGSISDAVLYASLEKDFILESSFRKRYSILFYARFRDDILIATNADLDTNRELLSKIRAEASPFIITLDSVSREGFQMLDVQGSLLSSGVLTFSLFQKDSSIWKPLSPDSLHPLSIHVHWPQAQCKRIAKRYSCPKKGTIAVERFKEKYKRLFGVPMLDLRKRHKTFSPVSHKTWLVLPYHKSLVSGRLSKVVSSLSVPDGLSCDKVGLSWALNSKHLVHRLRRSLD